MFIFSELSWCECDGVIAQLVERVLSMHEALGSIFMYD